MPSPTPLLGFTLPDSGTLAGTWGDVVNFQITSLVDSAIAGTTTLSTDADVTLTATTGAANQARQAILRFTGARTALRTITAPATSKTYSIINSTTGGFGVKLVGAGPTTGITIANGETALVAWNGSDFVRIANIGGPVSATTLTVSSTSSFANTATFTGNNPQVVLAPGSGSASMNVRAAASGSSASTFFLTGTANRWELTKNNVAESGSNVGSDFGINRYNDAGSLVDTPFSINRATGTVTVINSSSPTFLVTTPPAQTPSLQVRTPSAGFGGTLGFSTAASTRWEVQKNSTAESGSNAGSDFGINRYSDAGSYIDTPIFIARSTGIVTLSQGANITGGNLSVSGASSALGYAAGTGGTTTQTGTKASPVALNKVTGTITTASSSLAPSAEVGFVVTNSFAAVGDAVVVHRQSGGTDNAYFIFCDGVSAGSFRVLLTNRTGGSLSEAIVVKFTILKGANA
jgi:hypothetical protein